MPKVVFESQMLNTMHYSTWMDTCTSNCIVNNTDLTLKDGNHAKVLNNNNNNNNALSGFRHKILVGFHDLVRQVSSYPRYFVVTDRRR